MNKVCSTCKLEKEFTDFHKMKTGKAFASCKSCRNKLGAEKYQKLKENPEEFASVKQTRRAARVKSNFGLTWQQRETLLIQQDRKCAICKQLEVDLPKILGVDHDHKTGKIRGLLCTYCNLGLGMFRDIPERLHEAENYLKNHNG